MKNNEIRELLTQVREVLNKRKEKGILATAEKSLSANNYLCHKSPPKGYPEDKSEYGDSECYRYPLNTKARCLSAWRYVHQEQNKNILGGKFKKVESKIKNYAKKNYDLDLQTAESEIIDWEEAFMEYYDAETMGDRAEDIMLESADMVEDKNPNEVKDRMEKIEEVQKELDAAKSQVEAMKTDLNAKTEDIQAKATQIEDLSTELTGMKEEIETLRQFKADTEAAQERAEKIKERKAKVDEAGLDIDIESEADKWLAMNDEVFDYVVTNMSNYVKTSSASKKVKVPNISQSDDGDESATAIVRDGLKELKDKK